MLIDTEKLANKPPSRLPTAGPLHAALDGAATELSAVADTVELTSREAVEALHSLGLEAVMITAHNGAPAEAVARNVSVHHVLAEYMATEIRFFRDESKIVATIDE